MKKYTTIFAGVLVILFLSLMISSCDDSGITTPTTIAGKNIRTYGGGSSDVLTDMEQVTDGGLLLAGFTVSFGAGNNDFYAVKLSPTGDIAWSKAYGGAGSDICTSAIEAADGGFIFAGNTTSAGANGSDILLIKTDGSGHIIWSFDYVIPNDQYVSSVIEDVDGGYLVCGYSNELAVNNSEVMIMKVNTVGTFQWEKLYGGPFNDMGLKMIKTSDGGFLVAGATYSFSAVNEDIYLLKLKSDCTFDWSNTYGADGNDQAFNVIETHGHDFMISGSTTSYGLTHGAMLLFKTDHNGNVYTSDGWPRTIGDSSGNSVALSMALASDNSFYITGYTTNAAGNTSLFFAHYFNNSVFDFARSYGSPASNDKGVVLLASSNGYTIGGNTDANGPGISDFLTFGLPDSSGKYLSCISQNTFNPQGGSPTTLNVITAPTQSFPPAAENTLVPSITETVVVTVKGVICGQ
jgi:hypothetical protein